MLVQDVHNRPCSREVTLECIGNSTGIKHAQNKTMMNPEGCPCPFRVLWEKLTINTVTNLYQNQAIIVNGICSWGPYLGGHEHITLRTYLKI